MQSDGIEPYAKMSEVRPEEELLFSARKLTFHAYSIHPSIDWMAHLESLVSQHCADGYMDDDEEHVFELFQFNSLRVKTGNDTWSTQPVFIYRLVMSLFVIKTHMHTISISLPYIYGLFQQLSSFTLLPLYLLSILFQFSTYNDF